MRAAGLVLAGGRSRRFGSDKRFFRLGSKTLLQIAVENLRRVCERVYVSSDGPHLSVSNVEVVADPLKYMGPLRALEYLAKGSREEVFLVLPVDMPLLPEGLLERLLRWESFGSVVIPSTPKGIEPFPGLYPVSILLDYVGGSARSSMRDFLEWCDRRGLLLRLSVGSPLTNLNFYSDALKIARAFGM